MIRQFGFIVALWVVTEAGAPTSSLAEPRRFALLVGASTGEAGEVPLRYAEADAERMASILRDIGGFYSEDVVVLKTTKASEVRRALLALNVRARATSGDSLLFVYYSGHGDADGLQMAGTRFPLAELRDVMYGSPATARVLVIDACRSGSATRVKGGRRAPAFAIEFDDRLRSQGVAIVTSSSEGEDSQESDQLRASFFSHYLTSGLRGAADADADRRVTLSEAFSYAAERTLSATSRTVTGPQHPTFRYDLAGRADLVLTRPVAEGERIGALVFAEPGHYFVHQRGGAREPIAELDVAKKARTIAVPADAYLVTRRGPDHLLEGDVEVSAGGTVAVRGATMRRISYARVVRKGGTALSRATSVYAGAASRSALADLGPAVGGELGMRFEWPAVTLEARVSGLFYFSPNADNPKLLRGARDLNAMVAGLRSFDLDRTTLAIGIGAGLVHFERFPGIADDHLTPNEQFGVIFGPLGQVERPLGRRTYARLEMGALSYVFASQPDRPYTGTLVWSASLGLGAYL